MMYRVNTNNCYDSVIEQNLNTGLPKKISCITSKHLNGKRARKKQDDSDMSYEEKELNLRFRETWLEQKRIEKAFKEKENADAGDDRKIMFGLAQKNEGGSESRQPGFIKKATLFMTEETQRNIDRLEKESKEMAKDLGLPLSGADIDMS